MPRLLLSLALLLAGLWLVAAVLLWAVQERLIFFPDSRAVAPIMRALADRGATHRFALERVTTADGLMLAFVAAPPASPGMPVVVMTHGNAGNAADRIHFLNPIAQAGHGVVVVGWRGYGGETNFNNRTFDCQTWAASVGAVTNYSCIFSTVHVPLIHPLTAAKQAATIDHVTGGRFGLNVVCGWFKNEF